MTQERNTERNHVYSQTWLSAGMEMMLSTTVLRWYTRCGTVLRWYTRCGTRLSCKAVKG